MILQFRSRFHTRPHLRPKPTCALQLFQHALIFTGATALATSELTVIARPLDPPATASGPLSAGRASTPRRLPAKIALAGLDTPGDPGFTPSSAADSPAESSGPFDSSRGDIGEDDNISEKSPATKGFGKHPVRRRLDSSEPSPADRISDPLRGSPQISPDTTGVDAATILATMLPKRSDSPSDWYAPLECLHSPGEPCALSSCVPPPPCHPSLPPRPYDLIGVRGTPSGGPIYRGPCNGRASTDDDCHVSYAHRVWDRCVDFFYTPK